MARATHRLDLLVLPADPDAPVDALAPVLAAWAAAGFLGASSDDPEDLAPPVVSCAHASSPRLRYASGPRELVAGGVGSIVWMQEAQPRFLANRSGGFRVRCPDTGATLADRLHPAVEAWRRGSPRVLACACGVTHDLADLDYFPAAGFARGWIELDDVGDADLVAEARSLAPDVRLVLRRG